MAHDSLEVKTVYADPGPLCKCKAKRESPGPDHSVKCPWYANARLKKIHLRPEQRWDIIGKGMQISVVGTFHFTAWPKE